MTFVSFFSTATGTEPFPYQVRFATDAELPDLVVAPTGAGKTATAILGWLWRRRHNHSYSQGLTPGSLQLPKACH